jgi:hypothetical protein
MGATATPHGWANQPIVPKQQQQSGVAPMVQMQQPKTMGNDFTCALQIIFAF